jgi:hypothetical protein
MPCYGFDVSDPDRLTHFLAEGVVFLPDDAPAGPLARLRRVRVGDLVFAKTREPEADGGGLTLHAVGVAVGDVPEYVAGQGTGRAVKWQWAGQKKDGPVTLPPQGDGDDGLRARSFYDEPSPAVRLKVVELLFVGTESAAPATSGA